MVNQYNVFHYAAVVHCICVYRRRRRRHTFIIKYNNVWHACIITILYIAPMWWCWHYTNKAKKQKYRIKRILRDINMVDCCWLLL